MVWKNCKYYICSPNLTLGVTGWEAGINSRCVKSPSQTHNWHFIGSESPGASCSSFFFKSVGGSWRTQRKPMVAWGKKMNLKPSSWGYSAHKLWSRVASKKTQQNTRMKLLWVSDRVMSAQSTRQLLLAGNLPLTKASFSYLQPTVHYLGK